MIIKTHIPEVLGSAVDIFEIAEDTVPLIQKEEINNTEELTGEQITKINNAIDYKNLVEICGALKKELSVGHYASILKQFKIKEQDFKTENRQDNVQEAEVIVDTK